MARRAPVSDGGSTHLASANGAGVKIQTPQDATRLRETPGGWTTKLRPVKGAAARNRPYQQDTHVVARSQRGERNGSMEAAHGAGNGGAIPCRSTHGCLLC